MGVEDTGKALGLSELHFSYLKNGGDYHLFSIRLRALNEVMQTLECLADTSKGLEPMLPMVTQPPVWTMALAWLLRGKSTGMHGQGLVTCFSLPDSKGLWGQLLERGHSVLITAKIPYHKPQRPPLAITGIKSHTLNTALCQVDKRPPLPCSGSRRPVGGTDWTGHKQGCQHLWARAKSPLGSRL